MGWGERVLVRLASSHETKSRESGRACVRVCVCVCVYVVCTPYDTVQYLSMAVRSCGWACAQGRAGWFRWFRGLDDKKKTETKSKRREKKPSSYWAPLRRFPNGGYVLVFERGLPMRRKGARKLRWVLYCTYLAGGVSSAVQCMWCGVTKV
ncbi:hypothetical protein B0T24DRAFT_107164 [Lasiosphaeria ovina]|uniref:Uncharacterized protein n=1 Tax=Lasiosphaeria ovina TaxID=92902 RepID=A0AAE0MZ07_9PEZI|nr:hypothetical protein B0T24DRAFT_107164 [Lasiosphaeria ovina]